MGFWDLIDRFLPKFWEGVRVRNQIKSIHLENVQRLEDHQPVSCDFNDLEESLLGDFASSKHFQTKSRIRATGSKKQGGYSIHKRSDKNEIKELSKNTIWRIRLKNFFTIIFWVLFILAIILLLSATISIGAAVI